MKNINNYDILFKLNVESGRILLICSLYHVVIVEVGMRMRYGGRVNNCRDQPVLPFAERPCFDVEGGLYELLFY